MGAYLDDGHWRWRRQIRLPTGEKMRGAGTPAINTKRAALRAEHDWIEATLSGLRAPPEAPTLAEVEAEYLTHLRLHRSPSLLSGRTSSLRVHLLPWFGKTRLDRITTEMVDRFKTAKLAAGMKPSTLNQNLRALSNIMRFVSRTGRLREVLKFDAVPIEGIAEEIEYLTDEEVQALLSRAAGELRNMVIVALHTGVRIGELISLRWDDVDLKAARVTVRHNTFRGTDRPPKGKRARTIPLSRAAAEALRDQKHLRGPLVFCRRDGRQIIYETARTKAKRIGLEGWHVLRHTFGTTLSARGVPLRAIQEWMGHASITTTMVYAHFSPVMDSAIHVLDGETWQPGANRSDNLTDSKESSNG